MGGIIIVPIVSLLKLSSIERKLNDVQRALHKLQTPKQTQETTQPDTTTQSIQELSKPAVSTEDIPPVAIEIPEYELERQPEPEPVIQETIEPAWMETEESVEEVPVITFAEGSHQETNKEIFAAATVSEPIHRSRRPKKSNSLIFENLLSKIGIVTLVLGIGFFVKYAIDKDWINEIGRVGIGIITGGALIAIAHKLREKYNVFSAILVGGGISVFYITITLAFREYELFDQTVAFIILIVITVFSVILSLLYNRKELALFSLLGGYASPLMVSTGSGNYIILFSFTLILNSGMLLISMRKNWRIIGTVSFICTQLFYWGWLIFSFEDQRMGTLVFGILFFIQFYLLALFDHFLSDRKISFFQSMIILTNNLSLFAASVIIMRNIGYNIQGVITISLAVVNAIVMAILFRRANIDKRLLYLIIAIVLSFVSLAIPIQLRGHVITLFWAAEMVILLWMWNKSGIRVFHTAAILIAMLTLISYFMDVRSYYDYHTLPVIINKLCITGVVLVAALGIFRLLLIRGRKINLVGINIALQIKFINTAFIIMAYLVPFFEIAFQISSRDIDSINNFRSMILVCYSILYIAILAFIYRKKAATSKALIYSFIGAIIAYTVIGLPILISSREDILLLEFSRNLFLFHYMGLFALGYVMYVIVSNLKFLPGKLFTVSGWLLVLLSVIILSVELDNTVLQWWGSTDNFRKILYDTRTFGYPILWGLLAMVLMIWGLKQKEVLLRQISLAFFAFIILKFYIRDIWLMSQTGRIISFVALGVILLLVSFLIQKIKALIKDDHDPSDKK